MRSWSGAVALLAAVVGSLLVPAPVFAEGGFDYSVPTDGATVGEPISEIRVAFSGPVTLVGSGFVVVDPQGETLIPFVATDDDLVFKLQLDAPIGGGTAAVTYQVRIDGGWVVRGGFEFAIAAEAPSSTSASTSVPASATGSPVPTSTTSMAATPSSTVVVRPTVVDTAPAEGPDPVAPPETSGAGLPAVPLAAGGVALVALVFVVLRSKLRWQGVDQ
jgi:methionine-rich copper-binding protein CopC